MKISAFLIFFLAVFLLETGFNAVQLYASDINFNRDIRPILSKNCFQCHGPDDAKREAGLRLDTSKGSLTKLGNYLAIVPGKPESSLVMERITAINPDVVMPPPDNNLEKLTPKQIQLIKQWIQEGAKYEQHWAFQPIRDPDLPVVKQKDWCRNGIDSFILKHLELKNIKPSQEADPHTLIRRVKLDLTGLPPTLAEVNAFLADQSENAYEKMVDQTLRSLHYGEKWGQHWLDQARYADTDGYAIDAMRSMWLYRDWVIDSLNNDKGFDQFTIEQIAGDLLEKPTQDQLIATGFHRNTLINGEGGSDNEQFRNEAVVDRVNTTGAVWLGLTIGCAQCHTHKYDPITHREYYEMFAFFNSSEDINTRNPELQIITPEQKEKLTQLDRRIMNAQTKLTNYNEVKNAAASEDKNELLTEVKKYQDEKSKFIDSIPLTLIMHELPKPRSTHVLVRGDFLRKGDAVQPGTPAVLHPLVATSKSLNRLDLARWLVDEKNPLTARVTVNRIWMRYFSQGLVETENDFGFQGALPTHPLLLDWLASSFIKQGWSLKKLHKMIVTSATYRQSSHTRPDLNQIDPYNKLLARQTRLRVDAEIVRDLALSVSGLLTKKIGGPSVFPPQPDGVYAFTQKRFKWNTSKGEDRYRRGMYTFFKRTAPYPMLTTFDVPHFNSTCTRRNRSNTPLQSLTMANDEIIVEIARAFGKRILEKNLCSDHQKLQYAFQICFSRPVNSKELIQLTDYLNQQRKIFEQSVKNAQLVAGSDIHKTISVSESASWTAVARVLLNLDEFITRE